MSNWMNTNRIETAARLLNVAFFGPALPICGLFCWNRSRRM